MSPPLSQKEKKRLEALHRYHVLDAGPLKPLDDLVMLTAQISGAPVAVINFIDHERQWFKARVGMPLTGIPRSVGPCSRTLTHDDLFIIPDMQADKVFAEDPVMKEHKIGFYAGMPLLTPDAYAIGTLCVLDFQPRELSTEQQEAMRALARQVVSQLELRRNLESLRENIRRREAAEKARGKAEQRLIQSHKLEMLGNLANGIAHNFNNSLQIIIMYGEMLLAGLPEGGETRAELNDIIKEACMATDLIKQIQAFTGQKNPQPRQLDLPAIIKEALQLLRVSMPPEIKIREQIAPGAHPAAGVSSQIRQAILCLGINAVEAMQEKGGLLTAKLESVQVDKKTRGCPS